MSDPVLILCQKIIFITVGTRDSNAGSSWCAGGLYRQSDGVSTFHGEEKIAAVFSLPLRPAGQAPAPAQAGYFRSTRDQPGRGAGPCRVHRKKGRAGLLSKNPGGGGAFSTTPFTAMGEQRNAMENSSLPSTGTLPSSAKSLTKNRKSA